MKTYLTVAEMMLKLRIPQSQYNNFKQWCYRHQDELDPIDCKWNHAYYAYNVDLVREKYPHVALAKPDKVSTPEPDKTPVETPLSAAERLAAAINTSTGQNLTGGDVLDAFNRGKDYQRMRRLMARTLWRMRKERRLTRIFSRNAMRHSDHCISAKMNAMQCETHCRNYSESCKVNAERAIDACGNYRESKKEIVERAALAAGTTMILFIVFAITLLTHIFMS